MAIIYELSNGRKSGTLPVIIPFNILHLLTPLETISSYEFKGLWKQIEENHVALPYSSFESRYFSLNLQRATNLAKLKQILCLGQCGFAEVSEVESQANALCLVAQISNPEIVATYPPEDQADMTTCVFLKLELTQEGEECSLQVATCKDIHEISSTVIDSIIKLVGKSY